MTRHYLTGALAFVAALILAWAPTKAMALTSDYLNVKVPFQFVVGNSVLPAGQYQLQVDDTEPSVVWFVSPDGEHVANVVTQWGGSPAEGAQAKLLFDVYGTTHFLSQIRIPGEDGRLVALTRDEVASELAHLAAARAQNGAPSRP
jgi:hypothetical protein